MDYTNDVKMLGGVFEAMIHNHQTMGMDYKNIYLARVAVEILMHHLPDSVPGEFDDVAGKTRLLNQMLEYCTETDMPRFCIGLRETIDRHAPSEGNTRTLAMLRDYISPKLTMDEWIKKWNRHLRFDPIERSEMWEEIIYDVEREVAHRLDFDKWCMGFCFEYWSVKRDVLHEQGVRWRTPGEMNPDVMFD